MEILLKHYQVYPGQYSVVITDANNCIQYDTVNLVQPSEITNDSSLLLLIILIVMVILQKYKYLQQEEHCLIHLYGVMVPHLKI